MVPSLTQLLYHLRHRSPSAVDPASDAALLERFARQRDETAFTALVARHGLMVWRVCRRVLADAHAAEDAFQAAFLALARRPEAVRKPHALAAWLHGVALRVALKVRAAGRRATCATLPDALVPPDPHLDPLAEVSARELLTILDEEVRRLPQVYRLPILLCCLEGLSQEEAACRLGWTTGSVKGRLERGRRCLHARLVRRGLTLPAALAAVEAFRCVAVAVPVRLADATVRMALVAAGRVPAVFALAEGVLQSMGRTKLMKGRGMLAMLTLLGTAALTCCVLAGGQKGGNSDRAEKPSARAEQGTPPPVKGEDGPQRQALAMPRLDRDGKPLPPGAVARMGRTARGKMSVRCLACSHDGKVIATGGRDETVRLWDAATGQEIRRFRGHRGDVNTLTFSPNDKILASGSGDIYRLDEVAPLRLWDLTSGKEKRLTSSTLPPHNFRQEILTLAFSPDGRVLASAGQPMVGGLRCDVIRLWDWATGKELRRFGGVTRIRSLAFAADGKTLVTSECDTNGPGLETIRRWDAATGKERSKIVRKTGGLFYGVAFSPDGHTLAWSENERRPLGDKGSPKVGRIVRLWDVLSGKLLPGLDGRQEGVGPVAFAPDGKTLVTGDVDGPRVRLWEVATGRERRCFEARQGSVNCVAFAPGGRTVISGNGEATVLVWDAMAPANRQMPRKGGLLRQDVDALWEALSGGDAPAAYRALWTLVGAPRQAVSALRARLRPAAGDPRRLPGLLADLDSKRFEVREQATGELERFGEIAEPSLRRLLAGKPSLEVRRRGERLLDRLIPRRSPERLRSVRAVEALEQIGTRPARDVLAALSKGAPEALLTREAKAALERLDRRR